MPLGTDFSGKGQINITGPAAVSVSEYPFCILFNMQALKNRLIFFRIALAAFRGCGCGEPELQTAGEENSWSGLMGATNLRGGQDTQDTQDTQDARTQDPHSHPTERQHLAAPK